MTDRELLEKAAKAAGRWATDFELGDDDKPLYIAEAGLKLAWGAGWWNPLTDDGDALRLAVKLGISVMQPSRPEDRGVLALWDGDGVREAAANDPCAATRRAIVRAAAALEDR